jgi:hypothetical protein
MLFLRTLDQSRGIAARKTRIIASEDAICVDGMVVNRMRGVIMWWRLRGQSRNARRSEATGQSRRRCEDAREVFPDGRPDARDSMKSFALSGGMGTRVGRVERFIKIKKRSRN